MLAVEGLVFVTSLVATTSLGWCVRRASQYVLGSSDQPDDDDDDVESGVESGVPPRIRLMVSADLVGDEGTACTDDGFEEVDLDTAGLYNVADLRRTVAASFCEGQGGAAERAVVRRMVVQCVDEERDALVALPGSTSLRQLRQVAELIVTLRSGGAGDVGGSIETPAAGLLAQRKAQLLHRLNSSRPGRPEAKVGDVERPNGGGEGSSLVGSRIGAIEGGKISLDGLPSKLRNSIRSSRERGGEAELRREFDARNARRRADAQPPPLAPPAEGRRRDAPARAEPEAADDGSDEIDEADELEISRLAREALQTTGGARTPAVLPPPPPPPPAPPTKAGGSSTRGSFLDSPEFAAKLERRRSELEASEREQQPQQRAGEAHAQLPELVAGGVGEGGASDGGPSYMEQLAQQLSARHPFP